MNIDADKLIQTAEEEIQPQIEDIHNISYVNQIKVLQAFRSHQVNPSHFYSTTGYGYNEPGRQTLESIYAEIFGGEDALVRSQIVSGTHALAVTLSACLSPGQVLLALPGRPYDTLHQVITGKKGLVEQGIIYQEVPINQPGLCDSLSLTKLMKQKPAVVLIQRSRGYSIQRKSLSIMEISELIQVIKGESHDSIVVVDNCYGEFVEEMEPGQVGADLTVGSLIKNPGGGLAPGGGYIVGKSHLVQRVADHFIAPGLGKEIGPSWYDLRIVFQGLFLAPHAVAEALKGAVLLANVFARLGFPVSPLWNEKRSDIVQSIKLDHLGQMQEFVHKVQEYSPVDSHVTPEYAPMPGYEDQIIMAAGTFVQGASLELSCDAPSRKPYWAFIQGGISYQHTRYVISKLIELAASWK